MLSPKTTFRFSAVDCLTKGVSEPCTDLPDVVLTLGEILVCGCKT